MPIEIDGIVFDELTSDPASPSEGEAWYNSSEKKAKVYASGSVRELVSVFGVPDDGDVVTWVAANNRWEPAKPWDNWGGFGAYYQYENDDSADSTTGTSYLQKVRLTTVSLPAGDYWVQWYAETNTHNSFEIKLRIQVDDTTNLTEQEHKNTQQSAWYPWNGFKQVTLGAGVHTVDMDYASGKKRKEVEIQQARIAIWKVG